MVARDRSYLLEVNRGSSDNCDVWIEKLKRAGLTVDRLPHLTAVIVHRPAAMKRREFKRSLVAIMQKRSTASLLVGDDRGKWYICRNGGNRPRKFVRLS